MLGLPCNIHVKEESLYELKRVVMIKCL
jgi:hypothetical protein